MVPASQSHLRDVETGSLVGREHENEVSLLQVRAGGGGDPGDTPSLWAVIVDSIFIASNNATG